METLQPNEKTVQLSKKVNLKDPLNINELSPEQLYAYKKFIKNENLFITGPGGTGKTRLVKHLLAYADSINKSIAICAMTGCASVLLNCNARTLHSWSGIKLAKGLKSKIIESVLRNRKAMKSWKKAKILILDEVSMLSKRVFEIIEEIARIVRANLSPFGGLQVVFTGDFFQLPPVSTDDEPEEFCFESPIWNRVFKMENHVELKTMFRQKDPLYIEILQQIRHGELDEDKKRILQGYVKREYDATKHNGCIPTKLFPIRAKADYVNKMMFDNIKEKEHVFEVIKRKDCRTNIESSKPLSLDVLEKCSSLSQKDIDFEIDQMINNTSCSQILRLKKGAAVMSTVNLDMENSISNGSQGIVIDILENGLPVVKFSNGIIKTISPHFWQSEEYPTLAVGQYPLCLAWALTIHKIQGATLELAEIDIGQSVFEYGQTYVALSRIQSLDGLYLSAFHAQKIRANPKVIEFYKTIKSIPINLHLTEEIPIVSITQNEMGTLNDVFDFKKYELNDNNIKIIKLDSIIDKTSTNKISTSQLSLDLFLQGKSIQEISIIRELKENTIYEHIISFMPHKDLTYDRFMTLEEYNEIIKAFEKFGKNSLLKPIKDNISDTISYEKIKFIKSINV